MKNYSIFGIGALSLGLLALPGMAWAQAPGKPAAQLDLPGPIDSLRDVQDTGRMLFMLADVNHDGQISQREAVDAGDLVVGGFFFRADADGNGVVTQQEADASRDAYLSQNPWAKYVFDTIQSETKQNRRNSNQPDLIQSLSSVLDTNNDKQIQASELRQLVQTTTQSLFAAADTNRDGQMSPSEVNAAVAGGAKAIGLAIFQQADGDHNGSLSRAEFDKAIVEPANIAFKIADLNHDGQISQQEAEKLQQVVVSEVRMLKLPEPANSPSRLMESGRLPREAAPVPTFGTGAVGNTNNNAAPAQPVAPR